MGSFFVALIGLLCLAGGKAVDSANKKNFENQRKEVDRAKNTIYENLRMNYRVEEIISELNKLSISEISTVLGEDFTYITNRKCDEEYFREMLSDCKYDRRIKETIMLLWLSHHGVIDEHFANFGGTMLYVLDVYIPKQEEPSHISLYEKGLDYKTQIEEKKKIMRVRVLQRIEYNLRKKYPELRFVFSTEYSAGEKVEDIHRLRFRLQHEVLRDSLPSMIRGWDDELTNPPGYEPVKELVWNDLSTGAKVETVTTSLIIFGLIVILAFWLQSCRS